MGRRPFSREFKLKAVRLVRERGVSVVQASRDLDIGENVLARCTQGLPDQRPRTCRRVRLHRTLLQSEPPPLDHRVCQPYGVRADGRLGLRNVSTKPAAAH